MAYAGGLGVASGPFLLRWVYFRIGFRTGLVCQVEVMLLAGLTGFRG